MSLLLLQQELLKVLAENIEKRYPQVIRASEIAARLNKSEKLTRQVVRSMDGLGLIESDMDGQYALITPKGLLRVKQMSH